MPDSKRPSSRGKELAYFERMKANAERRLASAEPGTVSHGAATLELQSANKAIELIERGLIDDVPTSTAKQKESSKKPVKQKRTAKTAPPDFPLYRHRSGHWAKKVGGKTCYFGRISDDPNGQAALEKWIDKRDGRGNNEEATTVKYAVNSFLTHKQELLDSGELAQRTLDYYKHVGEVVGKVLTKEKTLESLTPQDFQKLRTYMAKRWGAVRLGNMITVVRSIFKFAFDAGLITHAVRFGPGFIKPSAKTLRQERAKRGVQMFESNELQKVLAEAGPNVKAMTLLAINAALGNTDLALLPVKAIDLDKGWLTYARTKTGIMRRIPLWPETIQAIRDCLAKRPKPKNPADAPLLFISQQGLNYIAGHTGYRVGHEFGYVVKRAGIKDRSFYDLRRTFQTIADGSHDAVAVSAIMGHAAASNDMASIYRQRIDDARLVAVVNHVRGWLFPPTEQPLDEPKDEASPKPAKQAPSQVAESSDDRPRLRVVG